MARADRSPSAYVPGLDGLRAICVTLVVLSHLEFGAVVPGGLGVTIFFFISGYLIIRLLMAEHDAFGAVDLPRFYGRRLLRLLPELMVLMAVLGLGLGPLLNQPLRPSALAAGLFYWTNYYVIFGAGAACDHCAVTGHLWSLAVEEHFYLLAPLAMAAAAFAPRRLLALFGAAIVGAMAWRAVAYYGLHHSELYTYEATECRLDSIGWGCLAAVLERHSAGVAGLIRRRGGVVFALGAALMLVSLAVRDDGFRATFRYSLQGLSLLALVLPLATAPALAPLSRLLELAPLRWMGRRSYGGYLWHYTALSGVGFALGVNGPLQNASLHQRLLAAPLVLAATFALAALSYEWVFKPAQRLKPLLEPRAARGARTLFGARISSSSRAELVRQMSGEPPVGGGARLLVTMNLDHVVRLQKTPAFRAAYDRAWTVTIDGAPVWLYSRLKGFRIGRCTGSDLLADLVPALRPGLHRPFFVVSTDQTGGLLMDLLKRQGFADDQIGFASPPHGFEADAGRSQNLCDAIRGHGATHLIFGLGAPKSEIWIDRHRHALGDLFACCVGSGPDFLVGAARRAPKALQAVGLEWAWRVAHERNRLFRRYFIEAWGFIPAILRDLAEPDGAQLPAPAPAGHP
ncbi:MAG TPA: WecB/TagA/CpsF family glycosyltransferase [Caulobacteraceae bacterium]|jgi:exopolysaccharide biosynthesis WecB/TagA/CpsF family protein|nr:WecB/TagA/CpsF family glycosyltransferase [Caulobacteraceae bacterium]